jgi:hypothetical protein
MKKAAWSTIEMKRMPSRSLDHRDSQVSHLQIFTAMFPLIPFLIFAAVARLVQAQERTVNGQCLPPTRNDGTVETIRDVRVADPYRWLEDQNSPETRAWIDAQGRYTDAVLDSVPGREQITERLSELMKVDSVDLPSVFRGQIKDGTLFVSDELECPELARLPRGLTESCAEHLERNRL